MFQLSTAFISSTVTVTVPLDKRYVVEELAACTITPGCVTL